MYRIKRLLLDFQMPQLKLRIFLLVTNLEIENIYFLVMKYSTIFTPNKTKGMQHPAEI